MFPVLFVSESIYLGTRASGTRRAVERFDEVTCWRTLKTDRAASSPGQLSTALTIT